jgi:hypothetical protein
MNQAHDESTSRTNFPCPCTRASIPCIKKSFPFASVQESKAGMMSERNAAGVGAVGSLAFLLPCSYVTLLDLSQIWGGFWIALDCGFFLSAVGCSFAYQHQAVQISHLNKQLKEVQSFEETGRIMVCLSDKREKEQQEQQKNVVYSRNKLFSQ